MAELTINADEIAAALRAHVESFSTSLEQEQLGRVLEVGDGVARVAGLPGAAVNELLEFEGGLLGLALNLDEATIGAVVLGKSDHVAEGQAVKATGRILSVPVGDALIGRVVNGLGQPIDGKGPIPSDQERRMEVQAPGIAGRKPVHEPLQSGIKAIDAMTPVGRGQRELIIGDRKTGKTTVAIDTILNQKGQGVKCIYVAIGQKSSSVAQTVGTLTEHGAMDYTVVVNAPDIGAADIFTFLPQVTITPDGSGSPTISFGGVPGLAYRLQRALLLPSPWSTIATSTAPASGLIEYHDPNPPPNQAFYRTVYP